MRNSTPNMRPAGIDHVLMRCCNLIRLRPEVGFRWVAVALMRVIAGTLRSRPLQPIRDLDIRPTSDRLRETLFNVLTAGNPQALEGSVWVDLFAGTGAVGIEALSRGAVMVYFVECAKTAVALLRRNLQSLGITEGFQILQQESAHTISQLARQQIKPDYIF